MNERPTINGGISLRDTVADIVRKRDRAMALYGVAFDRLKDLADAIDDAHAARAEAAPAKRTSYNCHLDEEKARFLGAIKLPERTDYLAQARKLTDSDVWSHVVGMTDLDRLMDKTAKDQLRKQLMDDPPEATLENITATLDQFLLDADTIFRRGIAECFSKLDRRFRSHTGWKIGSRVILDNALDESGSWSYHSNKRDTIRDIERTFLILDGKRMPEEYAGLTAAIERQRDGRWGRRQGYVETEYFKVRTFMNGNVHIWFQCDDLLRRVNKLLAEYYGEVVPDGSEDRTEQAESDAALNRRSTALAKNDGFYPTPDNVVDRVFDWLPTYVNDGPRLRLLEPSAGTGNMARRAVKEGCIVDCVELHGGRAEALREEGIYNAVRCCDFLALSPPAADLLYERMVLNPPYARGMEIDHVMHALDFLKPDGCLVAILPAGIEFREDRKSAAFREHIRKMSGQFSDLPAGSFSAVGTNINTVLLKVWRDGRTFWR